MPVANVTVQDAAARLSEYRLIDVREPDEYVGELGHIDGAELVPLATIPQAAARLPKDANLLIICKSGGRSGRAADFLAAQGYGKVTNMVGGMLAWNAAGLPTKR